MGILDGLRTRRTFDQITAAIKVGDPSTFPFVTPWNESYDFNRVAFADAIGFDPPSNDRTAAMKLAPHARSVNLMKSTICRLPMRNLAGQAITPDQPKWLTQTGDGSSHQLRNAWSVDDLIHYGLSCWDRKYDGDEWVASQRINWDEWTINDDLDVEVNGQVVKPEDVVVFVGLHEGVLTFGADVLDDARALYRNVRARLLNPVPQLDLHQTAGDPLTDTEIDALIERWAAARQGINGGVSFTSEGIEINELGAADTQLMIEARNAAAVDLARLVGVHAGLIDATTPKASLNYETATGRNQEFVDFDIALYMTPISARLSLDDCTAPGERIDFDLTDLTAPAPSPTGPALED